VLTCDNLRRRGWEGPSRCPLCLVEEENADHLFLLCPFAKETWSEVLKMNQDSFNMPVTIQDMLKNWATYAPFCLTKKELLKTSWMWIPRFTCWKIWLERNNRIFRNESYTSIRVAIKARALMSEALETKINLHNSRALDVEEYQWLQALVPNLQQRATPISPPSAEWEIRLEEQDFIKWRSSLEDHCLFFDGASKGNPGAAGGGGVLLNPVGDLTLSYAWGLGQDTNNRAEALALWQGLVLARRKNLRSLVVFGDSRVILQAVISKKNLSQVHLAYLLMKIKMLVSKFQKIHFFHVLRGLNALADLEANNGMLLGRSILSVDGSVSFCNIP
jgi:ribonuclease HI